jgi:hypothetical protein
MSLKSSQQQSDSSLQDSPAHFLECIQACHECIQACEVCASTCLAEGDVAKLAHCIALGRSCADICALAEREMLRNSPFVAAICGVCAIACEACADECSRHDMDHCKACAEACRRCTDMCDQLAEIVANQP